MSEGEQKMTSGRIRSFDYIRGFCILLMMVSHGLSFWLLPGDMWLFALEGMIFAAFAVSGFVFVSGVSFGFSWARHKGPATGKDQYLKSFCHTLGLLIISIGYNIFTSTVFGLGWSGIFSWQILQSLAFCRLLSLLFTKVKKIGRMVISLGLIALSSILENLIGFNHPEGIGETIIFYLLFNPLDAYPLLVFLPIFLIGTIVGEAIHEVSIKRVEIKKFFKQWFIIGCLFLISGIVLGYQFESDTFYMGRPGMYWLHLNPALQFTSFPLLLDLNSYAWCLFYLGIHMLFLLFLFYYMDTNPARKKESAPSTKNLFYLFGTYSFTIYLGHFAAFIIPLELDCVTIWVPIIGLIFLIYLVIWQLHKVGKGRISIEFVLGIFGELVYRKLKNKSKHNVNAGNQ